MDAWELRQTIVTMNRSVFGERLRSTGTRETLISAILLHAEQRLQVDSGCPVEKITPSAVLEDDISENADLSDYSGDYVALGDSDSESIDEEDVVLATRKHRPVATSVACDDDVVLLSDESDEENVEDQAAVDCKEAESKTSLIKESPIIEQKCSSPLYAVAAPTISVQDPVDVAHRVFGIDTFRDGQRYA